MMPQRHRRRFITCTVVAAAFGLVSTQSFAASSDTRPRPWNARHQADIGRQHTKAVQRRKRKSAFAASESGDDGSDEAENSAEGHGPVHRGPHRPRRGRARRVRGGLGAAPVDAAHQR